MSFYPCSFVASDITTNKVALSDAPCLILYKIGEQKSGVICVYFILAEALISEERKLRNGCAENSFWAISAKRYTGQKLKLANFKTL